jgi:Bacterial TSP3 repeat
MRIKPLILVAVSTVALTQAISAQVAVNGTGSLVTNSNAATPGTSTYTYTLAKPTSTKVIVAGYYNDNGTATASATFDGNAATKFATNGRTAIACYFLPQPAPASTVIKFTLSGGGAPTAGIFVYELASVDTSGGEASVDSGTGSTITTTGTGKFVVNFHGINNSTGAGTVPAATSIIPSANSAVFNMNGGTGGGALCCGYSPSSGTAGSKTLGWTSGTDGEVSLALVQAGNPDADSDDLLDTWEIANFGNTTSYNGTVDPDNDGYTNEQEETANSNPNNSASIPGDIDGDGLSDPLELTYFGNLNQTPTGDYDGDYATNGEEIAAGTSPANASQWPDTDLDYMCDAWERAHGLNVGVDDAADDKDSDGSSNYDEFYAGSDPEDAAWTPYNSKLVHRWSFSGNLNDSVGGSNALVVNDTTANVGLSSSQNATSFTLNGGTKASSDYLNLGGNLLSSLQAGGVKPVTIELWATQNAIQNWSRIFDIGKNDGVTPVSNESLRMVWTQGTNINSDQVAWEGQATAGVPGNAPYVLAAPYHVIMTITPAVFSNGLISTGAHVTWYSAPASSSQSAGHPLYSYKGAFNTASDLRALVDSACTLGRSMYADNTASASYDEVRIWKGALSETERKLFQLLGPDNINRADADLDGFPDAWEMARFGNTTTASYSVDTDGDGEDDDTEFIQESNPNDAASTVTDSDKDNLDDAWERQYFKNLLQTGTGDPDGDYCNNELEENSGTDPTLASSSPDTDGDGLPDGWEYQYFGNLTTANATTNFDGDFDTDAEEYASGSNPTNRFSGRDVDADGLADYWEYFYFNPYVGTGPNANNPLWRSYTGANDFDGDIATNLMEFTAGTDPTNAASVSDTNTDGYFDGILLTATDALGQSSFNVGTNWTGAAVPVAGMNYLVPSGLRLRTPDVGSSTVTFAGSKLAIAGELGLKGDVSTFNANYVFSASSGTPTITNIVNAGGTVTLGGTLEYKSNSVLNAQNGAITLSGLVSGTGGLVLMDSTPTPLTPISVQFSNSANTYSGNIVLQPAVNLVVNGVLTPGTGSVFNVAPRSVGMTNSISGSGSITLAGSLNIDLTNTVASSGATWSLISTSSVTFNSGFTVTGSGFVSDGGSVGARVWTSGDGKYKFSESTGVLSYVGTGGYAGWAANAGLTAGVNDDSSQNPDGDSFANILEYQLHGSPLGFDGELVHISSDAIYLIFTFQRYDLSEADSTLVFQWSTNLENWNDVVIGAMGATDVNGVVVTIGEDLGTSGVDYDAITVKVPKSLAASGKLFGRLQGSSNP